MTPHHPAPCLRSNLVSNHHPLSHLSSLSLTPPHPLSHSVSPLPPSPCSGQGGVHSRGNPPLRAALRSLQGLGLDQELPGSWAHDDQGTVPGGWSGWQLTVGRQGWVERRWSKRRWWQCCHAQYCSARSARRTVASAGVGDTLSHPRTQAARPHTRREHCRMRGGLSLHAGYPHP